MDVPALLKKFKIHPKHSLGQNFLSSDTIADRIVGYAEPKKGDVFLEVGPGLGILTTRLIDAGARVVAVEKDTSVARGLREHLADSCGDSLEIINDDILDTDLKGLDFNKVISNLPFQISSPFTFKLLEAEFEMAVITYQLEFARRLTALPGEKDYSRLTVMAYKKADITLHKRIKAGSFHPPPKVDAAVVEIIPRAEPPFKVKDEKYFDKMVRELFNHRRKKIRTSLKSAHKVLGKGRDKKEFVEMVNKVSCGDKRPEELTPEELGELANDLLR